MIRVGTPFLFASDLDGTLLPNTGMMPPDGCIERTRGLLTALQQQGCPVCFVSGRHLLLARLGQGSFRLPAPDWWVCNVGSEIYDRQGQPNSDWQRHLGPPFDHRALTDVLSVIHHLRPQEPERNGPHKFSLYYPEPAPPDLQAEILSRAYAMHPTVKLIASVEESTNRALLDLLPLNAGKANALLYLAQHQGFARDQTFFAGDSGNDIDALLCGVLGDLVGNAPASVREEAVQRQHATPGANLYLARMVYGDGITEGLQHYGLISGAIPG